MIRDREIQHNYAQAEAAAQEAAKVDSSKPLASIQVQLWIVHPGAPLNCASRCTCQTFNFEIFFPRLPPNDLESQVRLADGSRLVVKLNHSHTVANLRTYIINARSSNCFSYIHLSFPTLVSFKATHLNCQLEYLFLSTWQILFILTNSYNLSQASVQWDCLLPADHFSKQRADGGGAGCLLILVSLKRKLSGQTERVTFFRSFRDNIKVSCCRPCRKLALWGLRCCSDSSDSSNYISKIHPKEYS